MNEDQGTLKKTIVYNQAPLPFQGQKRRFLKQFKEALKGLSKNNVYIDLFGGSGLLSHTVKQYYPEAKVIWNDYDNYSKRLNEISNTNILLDQIRLILHGIPRKIRISAPIRLAVLETVRKHQDRYGYVDYITLSGSLLFSAKYVTDYEQLSGETMYNRIKTTPYQCEGYLKGVQRVQADYKFLHSEYKDIPGVVYLVDPPYLSTDTSTYGNKTYWRLRDYLDVLNVLDGSDYFYFTSNKSQIVELCEWIESRTFTGNPFAGATTVSTDMRLNHTAGYTDIMLYNYRKQDDV